MDMQVDADVIVVGAGPSGLTVAAELASQGAKTLMLERRTEGVQSRAGTILPRVLELFEARGIADRFVRKTAEIQRNPFRPTHIYAGLHYVRWQLLGSRFGFTLVLPQNHTEEVLSQWADECGVAVRFGCEVSAVRQMPDRAEVEYAADGGSQVLSARYVVGADGGRSMVRKSTGLPFEGHDGTFTGMVVDAELVAPWAEGHFGTDNAVGWIRGFNFGPGITRFNIVHREAMKRAKDEPVTLEEVKTCMRDIAGEDFGVSGFRWASRFTDAMRAVPRLRQGRVFLVGESARIHYPASGVGMNFCIQDAFNLGWKLAAVVNGHSPESILDTYDAERLPVMAGLLRSVRSQCAMQFNFSEEGFALKRRFESTQMKIAEVNHGLALELNGIESAYPTADASHPLDGRPAPDLELVFADGGRRHLYELLRQGEWLLIDLAGLGAFDKLSVGAMPLRVFKAAAPLRPAELSRLSALLVRPDAYVAWAAEEAASSEDVVRQLQPWLSAAA